VTFAYFLARRCLSA